GYTFVGWFTAASGGTQVTSATEVTTAANHTLYAQWSMIPPTCYALTLSHNGQGSNPVASPTNSTGCPTGQYVAGASISLSGATPASGWHISGWTGTDNNSSTASANTVTMPASAHSAGVIYTQNTPAIQVDKTANVAEALVGEVITYTYVVRNVGDVSLANIQASDDRLGAITLDIGSSELAQGQVTTGTAIYTVVEDDLAMNAITNTVTVTGTYSDLDVQVTDIDTVTVQIKPAPAPSETILYFPLIVKNATLR
ncbi:MAG: InlB B-repeat-containing protein, partial [Anaerolineae bacterium]|nr:InlB B-repeat-containing protein [Anaerolineae bacterium]